MRYSILSAPSSVRHTLDVFGGYNHNLRIGEGEFYHMENLTSDRYPVLAARNKRGVFAQTAAAGLIAKDSLCYVNGTDFVINGYPVPMGLSDGEKQLVSMGAYVIILPDKKWINTLDLTDWGDIEAVFTSNSDVTFSLCDAAGGALPQPAVSAAAPEDPRNMALWLDTSASTPILKQYSADTGVWNVYTDSLVKIQCPGIGKAFAVFDGVSISGVLAQELESLNGSAVIRAIGEDFIAVPGVVGEPITQQTPAGAVTVARRMPDMDFVTQCGNRLWGCRYGTDRDGRTVNELYACKLGDFRNWNCFLGLSTDSWAASVGSDGPFTGAVTHLGHPVFFKEHCLHKIYTSPAGAHQVQDTPCRGVEQGSAKSLALVGDTVYYKSPGGICAYDGSLPVEVSQALGTEVYRNAVGGSAGHKYYVSMEDRAGAWHLFVLDTQKGLWHREDSLRVSAFCFCRGELYAVDPAGGRILALLGSGEPEADPVRWMAQTGELGLSAARHQYISRMVLMMGLGEGASADVFVQYDLSETWEHLCTVQGTGLGLTAIPIRPRRCGYLKLRLEGHGPVRLYALTKTMEEGSDL